DALAEARAPVHAAEIRAPEVDLRCANLFEADLPAGSFDFIYTIGVLGEHAPFDLYIAGRLFELLRPAGKLFFTVVDVDSRRPFMSPRRRLAESLCPVLPGPARERMRR